MFEITYQDKERLQSMMDCGKAYKEGKYDFTFENRFIVYHALIGEVISYIVLDKLTGYGSEVLRKRKNNELKKSQYRSITRQLLYSIKYIGDGRYCNVMESDPLEVIESIFKVILPEYGYGVREEQIDLAKKMFEGFTEKSVSLCEAEVGTGKTLAYLIASLVAKHYTERVTEQNMPITISTSSIELQKALVEKEIPNLSKMLKDFQIIVNPLSSVLRKGKEHYFCRMRFEDYMQNLKLHEEKHQKLIKAFETVNFAEKAFDLDKIELRPSIKDKICIKGSCQGCKYKDMCRYASYVNKARKDENLDFQVTNHNLYLSSLKMNEEDNASILRKSSLVIIDEAHKLKDAAEDTFGAVIDEKDITRYITAIKYLCGQKYDQATYKNKLIELLKLNKYLFSSLRAKTVKEDEEEQKGSMLKLSEKQLSVISKITDTITDLEQMHKGISGEMKNFGARIKRGFEMFLVPSKVNSWTNENDDSTLSLCCAPKNIGDVLFNTVWNKDISHVLTSGTMSDGTDFEFFKNENGISNLKNRLIMTTTTESPFDFDRNARLYIPKDMPFPDVEDDKYIQALSDKIVALVNATNGHTAILFTSYKLLNAVYEKTKEELSKYELICMTRGNKNAISDFKKSENAVLFASGAMWEGVDCIGDCLSSVIIPRLPFPIRSAMMEQKKLECDTVPEFVKKYAVPEMLIKLRQGVGRLIRTEKDTGLVTILDARANEGAYKTKVRNALKKYPKVYSMDEIKEYFKAVKPESYFN